MLEDIANHYLLIERQTSVHLGFTQPKGVKTMTKTNLTGKVALVTGGSRSIGAAIDADLPPTAPPSPSPTARRPIAPPASSPRSKQPAERLSPSPPTRAIRMRCAPP
jgi:hypothetical protein